MNNQGTFKGNVESEIRRVQAYLLNCNVQAVKGNAQHIQNYKDQINTLKERVAHTKLELTKFEELENEHPWEQIKDGVEDSWLALQDALQDVITNFEGEH